MFGLLGLPHILMRFYTVPDAKAARSSVLYATGFIGYFYLIIPIVGFGASALRRAATSIRQDRRRRQHGGAAARGAARRHAVPRLHRRRRVRDDPRGGRRPHARRRQRACRTTSSCTSCATGRRPSTSRCASRAIATVVFGVVAVAARASLFKGQNVAFMVGLAFAVAAAPTSRRCCCRSSGGASTPPGAVCSIVTGALRPCSLIVLSPTVWVDLLKNEAAIFPLRNPAIVSMTAAFLAGVVGSLATREARAEALFEDEKLRSISVSAPNDKAIGRRQKAKGKKAGTQCGESPACGWEQRRRQWRSSRRGSSAGANRRPARPCRGL